ncbi:hypothetical protein BT67DRAFT_117972 [Trichocladium antarcticum]|uniref:Uncharacterized protein n=1 Tax=Trichocladium antarcticum TaxID=1450529 RepID=A0AAN6ZFX3_9PEZI|nr:hypothetical protein BT67DRAFT_117972 [Trichocladium antarcticum]
MPWASFLLDCAARPFRCFIVITTPTFGFLLTRTLLHHFPFQANGSQPSAIKPVHLSLTLPLGNTQSIFHSPPWARKLPATCPSERHLRKTPKRHSNATQPNPSGAQTSESCPPLLANTFDQISHRT